MSFVVFSVELFSGDRGKALAELDELDRHVKAAAAEAKAAVAKREDPQKWGYKGIRRALEGRLGAGSTEQHSALLLVLTFVETSGQEGTLDVMRQLLRSQPAKG